MPLAISVLDANTLDSTGTFTVGELIEIQPSIQFYSSNQRNSAVNIRGLGAPFGLTNDGIEQGVGLYVDQVYYARSASATFDFLDVERVEVLRGPQGTLYGKNTTAGAINITSRKPSFTPEARVEASYGDYDFIQAKASVSGPLIDSKLAGRIGVSYTDRRGTILQHDLRQGHQRAEQHGREGPVAAACDGESRPDTLRRLQRPGPARLRPDLCRAPVRPSGRSIVSTPRSPRLPAITRRRASTRSTARPIWIADVGEEHLGGTSLLAEWNLGPGKVTSVSAWRSWRWGPANDRDFIGLPITTISQNPSRQDQWTQELRFAASGGTSTTLSACSASGQEIKTSGLQEQGALASRWLLSGANANNPAILNGLRSTNDIGLEEHEPCDVRSVHVARHRQTAVAARLARELRQEGRQVHRDGDQWDEHCADGRSTRCPRAAELPA